MSDRQLLAVFDKQAHACASLGSPMYGQLLGQVGDDIRGGGVFAAVLSGHEADDDLESSALPLRLLGGLHRLVLDGTAPRLRCRYPSTGGGWDAQAGWPDVVAVARDRSTALRAALDQPPQTNEVGGSAALIGALLILARRFPFPVRLFEIGASAGLNLRADHYLYRSSGGQWGASDAGVVIDDAWRGRPPPEVDLRIVERHGYDIAPIDVISRDARLTLLSYVWPDMPMRMQRLQAAIDTARHIPAAVDRMSAVAAVERLQLVRGTLTVLWHSVTWQYLTKREQEQVTAEVTALGTTASAVTPVCMAEP